ncbi:MAG: HAD hydrolase-like protein [Lachnospiraceae bacterium]|nr:HAD hydrolase-like protein [Lachnospiraceae bacterium]
MKAVLFDLDGTLLPMDQEVFVKAYFKELCKKAAPYGYDPDKLIKGIWTGTGAMVKNQGNKTNEDMFWDTFSGIFGEKAYTDKAVFNDFYANEFDIAKEVCGFNPDAGKLVKRLKNAGIKLVLASNPIFPIVAQKKRMQWAGIDPDDFEYITSYENSHYSKPNTMYYTELLKVLGYDANDVIMVGNDVSEDMCASEVGIKTFLLTDCMINAADKDISVFDRGGFRELENFLFGK